MTDEELRELVKRIMNYFANSYPKDCEDVKIMIKGAIDQSKWDKIQK